MHRSGFNWFLVIIVVLVLVIITATLLLIINNHNTNTDDDTLSQKPEDLVTEDDTASSPENSDKNDSVISSTPADSTIENKPTDKNEVPQEDKAEDETKEEIEEEQEEDSEEDIAEEPEYTPEETPEEAPPHSAGVDNPEDYLTKGALVAAMAESAIGAKEEFGGSGPDSFDTSGLVYFCFDESGVIAPRSFTEQAEYGTAVEREDLQPGDVVFFYSENKGEAEYVGIYTGDGTFVAVSSSRKEVCAMDLNSEYYTERFLFARRYCD